ncbi:hypothetical protein HOLleu_22960 [Holothuria leucospilota]|uniref:B box-type domain-containing protein n=1 Tax=Holothuria leucospilota TaxID=206669 RepID=A0A9Q1BTH1_HOLLE|nr:hypothetical protein HOLleu_22960 [Holothuria leucospilota]
MVAFCSDCEGLICKVCFFCHKTMKAMQGHTHVVTLEGIGSPNVSADDFNDAASYCSLHTDLIIEKYCLTCKEIVCASCDPSNTHQYHHVTKISKSERLVNIVKRLDNYLSMTKQNLSKQLTDVYDLKLTMTCNLTKVLSDIEMKYNEAIKEIYLERMMSLEELEIKEKEIKQKADIKLQMLKENEERTRNEASTLQMFCEQHLHRLEKETKQSLDKLQEISKCEERISSLLSAIEIRNDLQKHLASPTSPAPILEAITQVEIDFTSLECSLLTNICWHREQPMQVSLIDGPHLIADMNKIVCSGKDKIALAICHTFSRIIVLDVNDRESGANTADVLELSLSNLQSCYIVFSGKEQDTFFIVERNGSGFYLLDKRQPNDLVYSRLDLPMMPSDEVTCAVQSPNGEGILISTSRSSTIYRCNRYDYNMMASVSIKDVNCQPPVSLAVSETFKDFIFLCDGDKKAMAIDQNGDVVCQFFGKSNQLDRPLKITVDRSQFVYVLWEVEDDSEGPYNDDDGEDFEEMIEGEYEGEYDIEFTYSCRKVVRQYSLSGTFISEFDVYTDVTMMTTLQRDSTTDVLIVGSADGVLSFYTMTQFGRTWSSFIQKIGSRKKVLCSGQT